MVTSDITIPRSTGFQPVNLPANEFAEISAKVQMGGMKILGRLRSPQAMETVRVHPEDQSRTRFQSAVWMASPSLIAVYKVLCYH
jgi:hypothetical protein